MNTVIIVSGPSGVGKSTVISKLLNKNSNLKPVKSITTRKKREDGTDTYKYVSHKKFKELSDESGFFLETNQYSGNEEWYGTPQSEVNNLIEQNKIPVLDIDVNGYLQVTKKANDINANIISVFILTNADEIYGRLVARGTDSIENIIKRLKVGKTEILTAKECYDYIVCNEDSAEQTADLINNIINGNGTHDGAMIDTDKLISDLDGIIDNLSNIDSVDSLMNRVATFTRIRDWDKYNNPKDLACGVVTEASELLDIFRFKTSEQMEEIMQNMQIREHIGEELADILFFILRFCDKYNFSPGEILVDKIEKNAMKYPIEKVKGKNLKSTEYKN